MNAFSCRISLIVLLFCALTCPQLLAEPDTGENSALVKEAVDSAQSWMAEIDAGHYDQSYSEGCLAFHNKVTRAEWTAVLKSLRPPLGTVVSRKVANYSYKPDGYEGLQGECIVITFNTVFSKVPADIEVVVLKREEGQWRGAGYNAQPQGDAPTEPIPPATPQTEVNQQPVH